MAAESTEITLKTYKPPFPYFGGKSRIAHLVWQGIGADMPHYSEPFFGSGAVLFLRPGGAGKVETVNDADGFIANFWRAVRADPEAVAYHADYPASECDLHARNLFVVARRAQLTDRLMGDPEYFDTRIAGWWAWGQSVAIANSWCSQNVGPWIGVDGRITRGAPGGGIKRSIPSLVRPRGVRRHRLGTCAEQHAALLDELSRLADRLQNVRVVCGDWSRITSYSATTLNGLTGMFLDPPYADTAERYSRIYASDSLTIAHDVRRWAIEHGDDPFFRIVLAGYEGEHKMPKSWRVIAWKVQGGMANIGNGKGKENRHRERLWFSPHCLPVATADRPAKTNGNARMKERVLPYADLA